MNIENEQGEDVKKVKFREKYKKEIKIALTIIVGLSVIYVLFFGFIFIGISYNNSKKEQINTRNKNENVKLAELKSITLVGKNKLHVGGKTTLNLELSPKNAKCEVSEWKTSDEKIIVVDKNGNIEAKKIGKATITVVTTDGKSAELTIETYNGVNKIELSKKEISIQEGKSEQIVSKIYPNNADNKKIIYESSNDYIVTVDDKGKVHGEKEGTSIVTIRSKDTGVEASIRVNVYSIKAEKITIKGNENTIKKGESLTLKTEITPKNSTQKDIYWTSSNDSVISVDSNGKITAKNIGSATITASVNYGSCKISREFKVYDIEVNIRKFVKTYYENVLNANKKYMGKYIKITGTLNNIDIDDSIFFNLGTTAFLKSNSYYDIACNFKDGDLTGLSDHKKGKSITIIGKVDELRDGWPKKVVYLEECKVVK